MTKEISNCEEHLYKLLGTMHGLSTGAGIYASSDRDVSVEIWQCVHCGFRMEHDMEIFDKQSLKDRIDELEDTEAIDVSDMRLVDRMQMHNDLYKKTLLGLKWKLHEREESKTQTEDKTI